MKDTKGHDLLADRIAECLAAAQALCVSDPASVMHGASSDLRRALSAVRDRAAALRVRGAGGPAIRRHKQAPSDVLRDIYASRIRYARPRRRILAGLLGGRG